MILVDARGRPCAPRIGGRATLDDLFKRAAGRRPDAMALLDAPDRERVSDGEPRALTYRQADRVVSAIAGRLRRMGLHTDAIVAIQMASTVENVLTILGVLRAGLIAMPLPVWWRRADIIAALNRIGPMALIVSSRIAAGDHYQLAIRVAAEVFPIRYVCGYGRNTPDGLVCFDDHSGRDRSAARVGRRAGGAARPRRPPRCRHMGHVDRWPRPGRTQPCRIDCGWARRHPRKPSSPGRESAFDPDPVFVRGNRQHHGAMASCRRHARAAPSVRSGCVPCSSRRSTPIASSCRDRSPGSSRKGAGLAWAPFRPISSPCGGRPNG